MSFVGLLVEKPGPLSLIQDFGRFGLAHIGITQSGPVDDYAYSWSNHLLGNPVNCSVIEITLGNASFKALTDCHMAICGGDLNATVNGRLIPTRVVGRSNAKRRTAENRRYDWI